MSAGLSCQCMCLPSQTLTVATEPSSSFGIRLCVSVACIVSNCWVICCSTQSTFSVELNIMYHVFLKVDLGSCCTLSCVGTGLNLPLLYPRTQIPTHPHPGCCLHCCMDTCSPDVLQASGELF